MAESAKKEDVKKEFTRVPRNSIYWNVSIDFLGVHESQQRETNNLDENNFKSNNYFHSWERAHEVRCQMEHLLKLNRLHDMLCPGYEPDWTDANSLKYCVFFDTRYNTYRLAWLTVGKKDTDVYFPTRDTAQQACDILNKENEK